MFWDRKTETLKGKALTALQEKRLKTTVAQALKVPFYKKQFAAAGIRPSDIRTIADIGKIPFTKKQDLREGYPFGFLAVPLKEVVRIHTTSGTTGKPTVVGYTRKDLSAWADLIARNMYMAGVREGDVFQNMVNYGMFTGGLGFHYGAELLGVTTVPSATGNTK
ncbi:MAG TPA: phenylacetate--CoA ligase, partial [Methanoregulaceae archaeon]|nr:phenylacetate--CoA ligase [Methanoregulaceae archaeon]